MTAKDHRVAAAHPRQALSVGAVIGGANRAAKQYAVLVAAAVVALWGAGVAGGVVALNSLDTFRAAPACRGASAYVYEVPSYPAQRAPARAPAPAWPPGGNSYWGWMPRWHELQVGNWVRVDGGGIWKVAAIAALPGHCKFFGITGVLGSRTPRGGSLAGRLVLQPIG